jgi:nucleobase:cation symporter-1, NCS1 family
MMPWKLLTDFNSYIFGWLVGYSGLLGPIAGVIITDYFFIRKTNLDVPSLYQRNGIYEYRKGMNPIAMVSLAAGIVVALGGLIVPSVRWLYDYAWFVGFAVAAVVYYAGMQAKHGLRRGQLAT